MGIILAKFRKEKSTADVLENLEERISELELFTVNTEHQKRRIVGNFVACSIGLYIVCSLAFYFIYFPPTWKERLLNSIPLLLFPVVIWLLRKLFSWYFQRQLNKNAAKLKALRKEKREILDKVKDTETYKVAVSLLERYGEKPNVSGRSSALSLGATPSRPNQSLSLAPSASRLGVNRLNNNLNVSNTSLTLRGAASPSSTAITSSLNPATPAASTAGQQQLGRRTPFPIINQNERGVFERLVDVLIGDGPNNRFAMICKQCHGHNGMAHEEQFYYMPYRCAFCNTLNPARKARPVAPALEAPPTGSRQRLNSLGSSSSSSSDDSDSDALRRKTPQRALTTETTPRRIAAASAEAETAEPMELDNTTYAEPEPESQMGVTPLPDIEANTSEDSKNVEELKKDK